VRLVRSERQIEDPEDARLAHALFAYYDARQRQERGFYRVLWVYGRVAPWVLVPLLAFFAILAALYGAWGAAIVPLALLVLLVYARICGDVLRRRMAHTAELNGWT
jgi:hypothetical protein